VSTDDDDGRICMVLDKIFMAVTTSTKRGSTFINAAMEDANAKRSSLEGTPDKVAENIATLYGDGGNTTGEGERGAGKEGEEGRGKEGGGGKRGGGEGGRGKEGGIGEGGLGEGGLGDGGKGDLRIGGGGEGDGG